MKNKNFKNILSDERGISPLRATIIMIIIVIVFAALIALVVYKSAPEINKNPNIKYFPEEILKIRANNSNELAMLLGKVTGTKDCDTFDTRQVVIMPENNNTGYFAIVSVNTYCGNHFMRGS